MEFVMLGVVVAIAIVVVVVIDRLRGPVLCGVCRQPINGRYVVKRLDGKKRRICNRCSRQ